MATEPTPITSFRGAHGFLSNFYRLSRPIVLKGIEFWTAEHAFQACKTLDQNDRIRISKLPKPGQAKAYGRRVALRHDWEEVKVAEMYNVLRLKFRTNPELAEMLRNTGTADLIEGNTWGDTFWGVFCGKGENNLGIVLMQVRVDISQL